MAEFEVTSPITIDAVVIRNDTVVDGNVIVGIYGPVNTPEEAAGSALIVESSSTALVGTSSAQTITFAETTLQAGLYFVAAEYSSSTHTYSRGTASTFVNGWTQYYERGGGYGALTNPCPATTKSAASFPNMRVRGIS